MNSPALPGTIPNLLRRGSPVTLRARVYGDVSLMHGGQGVVHDAARGVAVVDTFAGSPCVVRYGSEDVALDLTDPTGRAHAAWWLAAQLPRGHQPRHHSIDTVSWIAGTYGWCLTGMSEAHRGWRGHEPVGQHVGIMPTMLSALTGLGLTGPRLLPDGSRWVDAEALRLVCLHVAGVSS